MLSRNASIMGRCQDKTLRCAGKVFALLPIAVVLAFPIDRSCANVVASIEMTIILFYSWFAALHDACMHGMHGMACASTDPDFIIGWTAVPDFIIH